MIFTARPGPKTTARHIQLYSSAYELAWKHICALQEQQPDVALRLHAAIRRQIKRGEFDPLIIACEALSDIRAAQTT